MRDVINISLPKEFTRVIEKAVKKGKYASTSEFFRNLLRSWMEEDISRQIVKSELEYKAGKGKKLRSLRDLR